MAAQLRVYRQRIRSAQTTKKITRAMELISASRIYKAQARVQESAPYTRAITRAVAAVAAHSNVKHLLTTEAENVRRAAIVIFSSDRGLAGAFNSQVIREALELETLLTGQGKEVVFYLVGRKAVGFFAFRSRIKGVYFSIITQALALAMWLIFLRNETMLGGTNGLTDFKTLLG